MRSRLVLILVALVVGVVLGAGQAPATFPTIDVRVPFPPRPFTAGGRTHLVYELHLTNLSPRRTTLEDIDVIDSAKPGAALLHLDRGALAGALQRIGAGDPADRLVFLPGQAAVAFIWVTASSQAQPSRLTHRLGLRVANPPAPGQSGAPAESSITIEGVNVDVSPQRPVQIASPLEGDLWLAANGPANSTGHRRTMMMFSGEARIAQRFAIDWVRLFEDGRTFHGDPRTNASYRAYGARALAVADGTVIDTHDGIPENVPDPVARAVPITPATLGGNYVLEDIGNGAYAFYAHMQPGSLKVRKGDRVKRGQMLGLVGNSGNSTEPHLHFHIVDRPSSFDGEGLPYALASIDVQAESEQVTPAIREKDGSVGVDPEAIRRWLTSPGRRGHEIPLDNAIVNFTTR